MINIFLQGIGIGRNVKVQRSPEKVFSSVAHKKLLGSSGITANPEENTGDAIWRMKQTVFY